MTGTHPTTTKTTARTATATATATATPASRRPPAPRASDLATIARELDAVDAGAAALVTGLDTAALAWRPAAGAWSLAEILAHLETTTATFLPAFDTAVAEAERRGLYAPPPYRLGAWGRLLVAYVEPPPFVRLPAPRPLHPPPVENPADALPRFLQSQTTMRQRLERLDHLDLGLDLDLARAPWISPIARWIRMNLITFLCVHTAHSRRHLWQGANRRREMGDSSASPSRAHPLVEVRSPSLPTP